MVLEILIDDNLAHVERRILRALAFGTLEPAGCSCLACKARSGRQARGKVQQVLVSFRRWKLAVKQQPFAAASSSFSVGSPHMSYVS